MIDVRLSLRDLKGNLRRNPLFLCCLCFFFFYWQWVMWLQLQKFGILKMFPFKDVGTFSGCWTLRVLRRKNKEAWSNKMANAKWGIHKTMVRDSVSAAAPRSNSAGRHDSILALVFLLDVGFCASQPLQSVVFKVWVERNWGQRCEHTALARI